MSEAWSSEKASEWYDSKGRWRAGCNFIPSTAVNVLEMFQTETYDAETIERELGWAADLGLTVIRVFLHNLLWEFYSNAFIEQLEHFLAIAQKFHIDVMFVLLDSCWNACPKIGKQLEPTYGMHNSQWVQCPGYDVIHDEGRFDELKGYIQGVVTHFKDDPRVYAWDVWNEPDNSGYAQQIIFPLLSKVVKWVREVDPSQPLTTGIWKDCSNWNDLHRLQLKSSDVISVHHYACFRTFKQCIAYLKKTFPGRPIMCTEYLARTDHNTFDPMLMHLKEEDAVAIHWGLVAGRSQTVFSFKTLVTPATEDPSIWYHDVFKTDGTPFDDKEVEYIKRATGKIAEAKVNG